LPSAPLFSCERVITVGPGAKLAGADVFVGLLLWSAIIMALPEFPWLAMS
jgi:hypothetical protein